MSKHRPDSGSVKLVTAIIRLITVIIRLLREESWSSLLPLVVTEAIGGGSAVI